MSRSQMRYHPRVGYVYMPSMKMRAPGANGGYLIRTNAAGFRSDREFVQQREPGTFRALLFGDSQTAGDGVANAGRYSELLEKAIPGFEIYNYAISGTGPDQQLLAYEEYADVEHDLLVIALYVENIRRVNRRLITSLEANGEKAYYSKPYYLLEKNELVLHNVPVPKKPFTEQTLPEDQRPYVYSYCETNFFSHQEKPRWGKLLPHGPLRRALKDLLIRFSRFQPLPDYDSPTNPDWILLRRILETWQQASDKPVLLVTIPHHSYFVSVGDCGGYQARFRELSQSTGCYLYDPLPDLWKFDAEERRSFWCDSAGHLSAEGHQALASLLTPVIANIMQESPGYLTEARVSDIAIPAC